MRSFKIICLLFCLIIVNSVQGGITGTISGIIRDKETGNILPGAAIVVEGTTMGTMADKNGFYMIHNLPAGTYDVSASMIGYSKLTSKTVRINVDLNKSLNFELTTEVLALDEVVVTNQRKLIQSDITSSTYFVSGEEINTNLPLDSYHEAITTLPGVVGNHFRGGRETEVLYMLDGLPIQGGISREISSYFPNSSIVEMMVQTGGFNAEYGHATSGIVNVVTKNGGNEVDGNVKIYSDFFDTGITGNDKTRRLEFNVGGPLMIGLGGPVINSKYFISADLNLSDTPFREELQEAFDSPIFTNYNFNSKLSFDIGRNTILAIQGLLSNWKWRKFDPQWELNVRGLAQHRHKSHRISASLTHTFNPRLFASFKVASYKYKREILGSTNGNNPNLVFEEPTDPTSPIIDGKQPWEEETRERVNIVKLDVVGMLSSSHLIKTGVDLQNYHMDSESIRFDAVPTLDQSMSIAFNKISNSFVYKPRFFSFYFQDKIEFKGITANLGVRYDLFSPRITVQEPREFQLLRATLRASTTQAKSANRAPISPRLGIAFPLSENERLHINYGWYYQMPPLYYLYTNSERSLSGYLPLVGDVDLEPIKTVSTEFSYKRIISNDMLFVLTGFTKKFDNLIDTQTFLLPENLIDRENGIVGVSRYTNSAFGRATGLELTLQKQINRNLSSRISYTFMKAKGTSSRAEDEFNSALFDLPANDENNEFPLSWDQRHSLILDVNYETKMVALNLLYRLFSPLPVSTPESSTPNNGRLSWRNILDLKLRFAPRKIFGRPINPFLEVRNLFNEENIINQPDDSGVRGYQLFDPINSNFGRRLRVGLSANF